jgi:predicted nucleotidyltransferase
MLDLAPHHKAQLLAILNAHLPGARVWAFGSRVTGRARPFSDLDLAVEGAVPLDTRTLAMLRDDLAESDLPMVVDVLDLRSVSNAFRAVIERERVPLLPAASGQHAA